MGKSRWGEDPEKAQDWQPRGLSLSWDFAIWLLNCPRKIQLCLSVVCWRSKESEARPVAGVKLQWSKNRDWSYYFLRVKTNQKQAKTLTREMMGSCLKCSQGIGTSDNACVRRWRKFQGGGAYRHSWHICCFREKQPEKGRGQCDVGSLESCPGQGGHTASMASLEDVKWGSVGTAVEKGGVNQMAKGCEVHEWPLSMALRVCQVPNSSSVIGYLLGDIKELSFVTVLIAAEPKTWADMQEQGINKALEVRGDPAKILGRAFNNHQQSHLVSRPHWHRASGT